MNFAIFLRTPFLKNTYGQLLLEIKKLDRKKVSYYQTRIEKSCSKNLISLLQKIKKNFSKNCKNMSEAYLTLCRTAMAELFCKNS